MFHIFVFLSLFALAAGDCEPLIFREGIKVLCANPLTNEPLECHGDKLPTGSVATYACASRFYFALNDDYDDGQLVCNSRGQWIGRAEFLAFSCILNCGVAQLDNAVGFVVGGTDTRPGQWPWHASIFARHNSSSELPYICGGTLLKPFNKGYVILTAAHCLADTAGTARTDYENFKILLGAEFSSLEDYGTVQETQIHKVRRIVFHKEFQKLTNDVQADIALIALEGTLELSDKVIPACFSKTLDLAIDGSKGEVVGFGQFSAGDSAAKSLTLRNVSLPVVDPNLCSDWRIRPLTSREICAGFENSQAICNSDNGGGYMFKANSNGHARYFIQGIASHGKLDTQNQTETCDSFSVFTRVNSYAKWIRETLEELFPENDSELAFQPVTLPSTTALPRTAYAENSDFLENAPESVALPAALPTQTVTTVLSLATSPSTTLGTTERSHTNSAPETFTDELSISELEEELQNVDALPQTVATVPTSKLPDVAVTADLKSPTLKTTETATISPPTSPAVAADVPTEVVSKESSTSVELTTRTNQQRRPSALVSQPTVNRVQQYDLNSLERHNYYREMHDAPPLRLSSEMKRRAQVYADKLVREGTFENENESGINKNVYYVTGNKVKADSAVVSAVNAWYDDIQSYNWDNPYYSTFSQVVWKETTEMGTGVATDGRRTIVVVAYFPAGNILGENGKYFKENVSRKQTDN